MGTHVSIQHLKNGVFRVSASVPSPKSSPVQAPTIMIKHLSILAWFAWIVSALGQGQINLNNRGFALVNDSTGKALTGTSFVAVVLYGSSESALPRAFAPSAFRASTTTYPGTWNPASTGGPGAIATLSGFAPGSTVTLKVGVYDSAVFGSWDAAAAALAAGKSTVPTQAGLSAAFTYAIPADPLAIPGGMEKFPGLKLTALGNTGPGNQAPSAVGQSLSVNAGSTATIVLAGTDPENAPLKFTVLTQPANGTLSGTAPNLVYTPKSGFSGNDGFTFKVNDGSLDSGVATVAITVKSVTVNQAPIADSQNVSLNVGQAGAIVLTGRDPEGAVLKFTLLTQPANGTLAGTAPNLTYTPKSGFTGNDGFTFKVNDGTLDSPVATVSISVSEAGAQINLNDRGFGLVTDATGKLLVGTSFVAKIFYGVSESALTQSFVPAPFRDASTTYPGSWNPAAAGGPGSIATLAGFKPGSTVTLKVAVYDTAVFASWDAAASALAAGKSTVPTQAGVSAAFTYAIPADPLAIPGGMEKFPGLKLTALGNTGPGNQAPSAVGQSLSVNAGSTAPIVLAGTDPENAPLKFTVLTQPANGTLSGTPPNLVYTPKAGFSGNDAFTFKVNDGSLDSGVATVALTVKASIVVVTPPEFPIEPPPWDMSPCICGPLVGNYETNQIHTWHVLADGGPLDLQLTAVTVNTNDPQTTIVDAFDGTNRIATVTVSYTAAEARANGLRWEKSASVNLGTFARGKVIRLESRIGGTPVTQTHHSLQFCGARWLAIDLPSFKALEEDRAAFRFNVKSGEPLVIDLDNVGIPTPATAFRYRLISPLGVVVKSGTNTIVAGPELSVASPAVGLWTLEMSPVGGEHYLLDKPVGADRHAYLDWYTSQRGVKEVQITVNDKPAKGFPFEVLLSRQREVGLPDDGDLVVSAVVTNGLARFVELPNGYYKVEVRPLVKEIPEIDYQEDWIYCNNPVTNLFAFTRLNKLPVFDVVANPTLDEGKPFNLALKATDPEGAPVVFSLVGGPAGLTVSPSGALNWTPTEEQGPSTNDVVVAVSDGFDSVTNRFSVVVREVNAAPVVAAVTRQTVDEGKPLTLALSATDADLPRQALVFQLVSGPAGLTVSAAGQVRWVPGEEFGGRTETVKVSVTDGLSTTPAEFQVAINEVNEAPVLTPVADQTIDPLKPLSLQLVATDADLPAQKLVFSLIAGPRGLAVSDSGLLEWIPAADQGSSTNKVEISVTDGSAKARATFVLVVRPSNTAPQIANAGLRRVSEKSNLDFQLTATDADVPAQKLTFSLVSGPEGLSINPSGVVSFSPTEAQGPSTNVVVVRVTDNGVPALSGTNSFTIIVAEVNEAPQLATVEDQTIDALKPWTIKLMAKDADLPPQKLSFALVDGPAGVAVDPNQGIVSWTPTADQASASHLITVSVSDGLRSVNGTFRVEVRASNFAPSFVNLTSRRIRESTLTSFRLIGRDIDVPVQTLTYGLVDGPKGLTVSEDGLLNWTPSEEQGPSTNVVTVRVTDNGTPARSTTNSFTLFVSEANTAPILVNAFSRSIFENAKFSSQLIARDADLPAQKLTFSLVSGPVGLTLTAGGLLEWTPSEDQGPSTNKVVVKVTDDAASPLSATTTITLTVREANSAPVFAMTTPSWPIVTVAAQSKLSVPLKATDADIPVQVLRYSLTRGPAGLTVSTNGLLEWTPPAALANTTNAVTVSVTDGVATVSTVFRVVVRPVGSGPGSEGKASQRTYLSMQVQPDQSLALKVVGPEGGRFRVESTTFLGVEWQTVDSVGEIETLGEDLPVVVPIPAEGTGEFRQFRLRKQ